MFGIGEWGHVHVCRGVCLVLLPTPLLTITRIKKINRAAVMNILVSGFLNMNDTTCMYYSVSL